MKSFVKLFVDSNCIKAMRCRFTRKISQKKWFCYFLAFSRVFLCFLVTLMLLMSIIRKSKNQGMKKLVFGFLSTDQEVLEFLWQVKLYRLCKIRSSTNHQSLERFRFDSMFKNTFQSGFLSILYSIGSKPLQIWDKKVRNGHIKRITDPDIQSFVLEIVGTNVSTTYITCPADPRKTLGIKLPYLVMIVKNMKKYFTFEVQVWKNMVLLILRSISHTWQCWQFIFGRLKDCYLKCNFRDCKTTLGQLQFNQ